MLRKLLKLHALIQNFNKQIVNKFIVKLSTLSLNKHESDVTQSDVRKEINEKI